jgi:hypothetical protein
MASHIGRRKFLATLGGAAAMWPLRLHGLRLHIVLLDDLLQDGRKTDGQCL